MVRDVRDLSAAELGEALRAGARGLLPAEAAVELLIAHGTWLGRRDFRTYVEYHPGIPGIVAVDRPMAFVAWSDAAAACPGSLPCSSGEASVLHLAASLGDGVPARLRDLVTGLDEPNITAVAQAVLRANGHRDATVCLGGEGVDQ